MKKIDITGWKQVFSFTFIQTVKAKSYISTLLVLCAIVAIGLPVMGYFNAPDDIAVEENSDGSVVVEEFEELNTVYVNYDKADEDIGSKFEDWVKEYSCEIKYIEDSKIEEIRKTLNNNNDICIVVINNNNGVYEVECITGWDTFDASEEQQSISYGIADDLKDLQMSKVISEDAMPDALKEVNVYASGEETGHDEGFMQKYSIWIVAITFLTFITTSAGTSIANSIVVEKSSRMVEYLMMTIKPMAIVFGKVLAGLCAVLIQFGAVIVSGVASTMVCSEVLDTNISAGMSGFISGEGLVDLSAGLNIGNVVVAILIILTGLLFFALVASIAGATVSKIEELNEGIMMFSMLVVVGAYMSLALSMSNLFDETGHLTGTFAMVCCLVPLSSMFTVPANLIMGSVPLYIGIASIVINIISIVLVLIVTSRIYEYMLFYNGVTLKIKDIIYIIRHGRVKEGK